MQWWDDSVAALQIANPDIDVTPTKHPRRTRLPLAIMGASGAGKTALWRRLTGQPAPDEMSLVTDTGYLVRPNRRGALALMAVPGQPCARRYAAIDFLFAADTLLSGVVFIASYGYDTIWPDRIEGVVKGLRDCDTLALRTRNLGRELDSLRQLADGIKRKVAVGAPRPYRPDWLVIVVNKVDLFWSEIDAAREYYCDDDDSAFVALLQEIHTSLGELENFRIEQIPTSIDPGDFLLRSSRGTIAAASQLTASQCNGSMQVLLSALEELT